MKKRLICTVGLPRSGKTTWAQQQMAPIVSPDQIRYALHGQRYQALAEPMVWAIARIMVRALFLAGHESVILDATSITRKRRDDWRDPEWEVLFHELGTSAEECVRRAKALNDDYILPVIERMALEVSAARGRRTAALRIHAVSNGWFVSATRAEQNVKTAAELYEARRAAKFLLRDSYEATVKPYRDLIGIAMKAKGLRVLPAMLDIGKRIPERPRTDHGVVAEPIAWCS